MRKERNPNATQAEQIEEVHDCLDGARDEIAEVSAKLDVHTAQTAKGFRVVNKRVAAVEKTVGGMAGHVGDLKEFVDTYEPWLKGGKKWFDWWTRWWRWALVTAGASLLTLVISSAYTAIQTALSPPASVAAVNAKTADRYTAADAAKDRAAQDARDQQILVSLQQVQATAQADHQTLVGADRAANPKARR